MRYKCEFFYGGGRRLSVYSDCIAELKGGFWLNNNLQFTRGNDGMIWIPPSRIIFITKTDDVNGLWTQD
jgi:hypothetical protein